MTRNQKLELTWIGKDNQPKLEPRILIEDPERSYTHPLFPSQEGNKRSPLLGGDKGVGLPSREGPGVGNMLIFGDNLLALKALEQDFAGKVKCIFIDPPYNTGSAFTHYDDGLEHSLWLTLMRDRLEILRRLLADDGSLWITIDDNEAHYLKVMCDEVFGRNNFVGNAIWEKADSPRMDAQFFSVRHDHLLVYAKNVSMTLWNKISIGEIPEHYDKLDAHGKKYYLKPLRAMGGQGDSRTARPTLYYALIAPDGTEVFPKRQDGTDGAWRWNKTKVQDEKERIDWVQGRNGWAPYYRIYADENGQRPPETIWTHTDVGSNRTSKAELKTLFPDLVPFGTPKPEKLLQRAISISTNPGDLVLDSFGGSGTTGAVAHKMGRRWIMVELGEHCHTHIIPRMRKVCDGTDQGGISKAVNWQGGGGFKYYYLAPSLLKEDKYGNWIIDEHYNADMLAAAMAKHEGFKYSPDEEIYWKQGKSTEKDCIFTTTNFVTIEFLDKIHDEMQPEESLLICCKSFHVACESRYPNITIKKIPRMLLGRCEFGKEDYSLNIVNMPPTPDPSQEGNYNPDSSQEEHTPAPSQEGNKRTPLLGGDRGVGKNTKAKIKKDQLEIFK